MAKVRKYQQYQIKVNFIDGGSETLKVSGICTSSYKEMLKLYNDVKETYTNDEKVNSILFLGVTADKQLEVMWEKLIKTTPDNPKFLNKNVDDILNSFDDQMTILNKRKDYLFHMIDVATKERDILLHMLEHGYDERIGKDLSDICVKRRNYKNELTRIKNLLVVLEPIDYKSTTKKVDVSEYDFCNPEYLEERNIWSKIKFDNVSQREIILNRYRDDSKFSKIVVDDCEGYIYLYNYIGEGKWKNKNKRLIINGEDVPRNISVSNVLSKQSRIIKEKKIKCNSLKMIENLKQNLTNKYNEFEIRKDTLELVARKTV